MILSSLNDWQHEFSCHLGLVNIKRSIKMLRFLSPKIGSSFHQKEKERMKERGGKWHCSRLKGTYEIKGLSSMTPFQFQCRRDGETVRHVCPLTLFGTLAALPRRPAAREKNPWNGFEGCGAPKTSPYDWIRCCKLEICPQLRATMRIQFSRG